MKAFASEFVVFFGALFASAGIVYGGYEITKPDRAAPAWRQRIADLERENAELRLRLDEMRRTEGKPHVATADNLPAQQLPTQ